MNKIKDTMVKSSIELLDLMNILIGHFCDSINFILEKIKSKLLYFLKLVELQIYVDILELSYDIEKLKEILSKIKPLVNKYIEMLDNSKKLLKTLKKLIKYNLKLINLINKVRHNQKIIRYLYHKFSEQNDKISRIVNYLSSINLEKHIQSRSDIKDIIPTLKKDLEKLNKHSSTIMKIKINFSDINDFQKSVESIKKLLEMIEVYDQEVSKEINHIIGQLFIVETINLVKLYGLITHIRLKYEIILIKGHLLVCAIEFYQEIQPTITSLCKSLEFNCSNVCGFLSSCSDLESKISTVSSSITNCIEKLAKSLNGCNTPNVLLFKSVLLNLIWIILILKFYVDLIAMEILIFKMIILNLIVMSVSSAILDGLMLHILNNITKVEDAIPTLMTSYWTLKTFYTIQLLNTRTILGLSSALNFSRYINQYYGVLLLNLYWINWLIWVIECYIYHLIVFKYTSVGLNSIYTLISEQFKVITDLGSLAKSMAAITDKLVSINNSIKQIKTVSDKMDITNWKESASKIRQETRLLNSNITQINSEISQMNGNVKSISESWATLLSLEYFLEGLISYVYLEIERSNKTIQVAMGISNRYYRGVIVSVMEPCNKQLMFIFKYLVYMWVITNNVIKIVGETLKLIYKEMGFLYGLTSILQTHITNINRGVLEVECAIEGVVLNFIKCTIKSLTTHLTISNSGNVRDAEVDNQVVGVYSVLNVNQYKDLVNRMLEFWTFCDESVELFKYIRFCGCSLNFESRYRGERPSTFDYPLHSMKTRDVNPVSELVRHTMAENVGNHLCLCLVIKYHLRPSLLKCILFLRNEELGTLDTISRKFDNYNSFVGVRSDLWKLCGLILNIIYELTSLLRNRYNFVWIRSSYPAEIKCFCTDTNTIDYHYILTISLYLSSLMENICSVDTETMRMSIECLSILISEFDMIDSQNIYVKFGKLNEIPLTKLPLKDLNIQISKIIINTCINSFFKFILSLSIMEYFEFSTVVYSIISSLSFYIIFNPLLIIKSIPKLLKTSLTFISIKNLECTKKEQCTCPVKNECKMCVIGKIIYLGLTITMKMIRYGLGSVIKHTMIDTLSLTTKVKIDFDRNYCVNSNIQMLRMTKNKLISSTGYTATSNSVTNVETRNWGYDTNYEHVVTNDKGFSNQYPYVTKPKSVSYPNRGSRMFKINDIKLNMNKIHINYFKTNLILNQTNMGRF